MAEHDLHSVAQALVAERKGILAADETVPTLAKCFDSLGILSTEQSRRTCRQMLFTSPGAAEFISGAIMHDETIRQKRSPRRSQWCGERREYTDEMEAASSAADDPPHRRDWRDD